MELDKSLLPRIARFGVVGLVVAAFNVGLNKLFEHGLGAWVAFAAAYAPSLALHFCLNKWWTFGCQSPDLGRQIREYLAMAAVTFLVQAAVFSLLHGMLGLPGWIAAGLAIAAQMALSFAAMQIRIFSNRGSA